MSIEHKTDYDTQAVDELLPSRPYGESVNIRGIISALMVQIQDIEDDAFAVSVQRSLDGAVGVQLEQIGALVGQGRLGSIDGIYRNYIRARILANNSEGTVNTMLDAVSLLTFGATINYLQIGSASFKLQWSVPAASTDTTAGVIVDIVEAMTPIGVGYALIETVTSPTPILILDDGAAGLDLGLMTSRRLT